MSQGGVDALKAIKLLLEQGKMDKDVILMLDEIYLQKDEEYTGGHMIGADVDGKLFKGKFLTLCKKAYIIHYSLSFLRHVYK